MFKNCQTVFYLGFNVPYKEVYVINAKIYLGMNSSSQSFPGAVIIMFFCIENILKL